MALGTYAIFGAVSSDLAAKEGHPEAWLALLALPVAALLRFRPVGMAIALVLGGAWLRIVFGSFVELGADQIPVVQSAIDVVLAGGNPYGIGYATSDPPGAPFVYGPLMLLWGWTGIWGEALASVATLALVGLARSWVTLAVMSTFPLFVLITTIGINDSTPGLLITAAMLALRWKPVVAGVLLAVATALKPYALAWLPGLIGVGGVSAGIGALTMSALAWSPLVVWGPGSLLRSVELARQVHAGSAAGGLNMPALRLVAVPLAVAGLVSRNWSLAVLSGSAIFVTVLFFDAWASFGYWLAVLPVTGIALERPSAARWRRWRARRLAA